MTSGNAMLDGILWGGAIGLRRMTTTITYYFAHAAEFVPEDRDWASIEQDAYRAALQSWASVANLQFTEVFNPAARRSLSIRCRTPSVMKASSWVA